MTGLSPKTFLQTVNGSCSKREASLSEQTTRSRFARSMVHLRCVWERAPRAVCRPTASGPWQFPGERRVISRCYPSERASRVKFLCLASGISRAGHIFFPMGGELCSTQANQAGRVAPLWWMNPAASYSRSHPRVFTREWPLRMASIWRVSHPNIESFFFH